MVIHSTIPKKSYLRILKASMDSHWDFLTERCTGFILGPLFCVTYHSGWEWNRKITNQKNTAVGIVRSNAEGTKIQYILLKGLLAPHYLLGIFLFYAMMIYFMISSKGDLGILFPVWFLITLIVTIVTALINAFMESLTDESYEGAGNLKGILTNPVDRYSVS